MASQSRNPSSRFSLNEAALQYYPRLQRVHTHVRERSFALFGRVGGG